MNVICPVCRRMSRAEKRHVGKKVHCPHCRASIRIPFSSGDTALERLERRVLAKGSVKATEAVPASNDSADMVMLSALSHDSSQRRKEKDALKHLSWGFYLFFPVILVIAVALDGRDPSLADKYALSSYPLIGWSYGGCAVGLLFFTALLQQWRRLWITSFVVFLSIFFSINIPVILFNTGSAFPYGTNISPESFYAWRYVDLEVLENRPDATVFRIANRGDRRIDRLVVSPTTDKGKILAAQRDVLERLEAVQVRPGETVTETISGGRQLPPGMYPVSSLRLMPPP